MKRYSLKQKIGNMFKAKFSPFPLLDLPYPALCLVGQYLPAKDLVNLCESHSNFEFLRFYLPEFLDIPGENFVERRGCPPYGYLCPELYFTSPVMNQEVKSIKMSFEWKDQGWGNRKGMLWVELVRKGKVIASSNEDYNFIAPHSSELREVEIRNHPVVDLIRKGDVLNFMRNVGGGGGHSLHVTDFNARLELKKY